MTDRNRTADGDARTPARRRRGEELVAAIHEAALEETVEHGLGRLSMEGIARRAGTAKTSLYRRWSSPEDIVIEALYRTYPMEEPSPGADDLRGDLIAALALMRDGAMQPVHGAVMAALLEEARRRPDLHERLYSDVFDARGGRFTRTVLLHYAEHGHIDPARLTPVVFDIGEALMLKYGLDTFALPDDAYIAAIVDQAILPAVGHGPGPPPSARV
ncbi:AcrR family transcriptional regulator [Spinactinospora alkalitolerans]|uniref:AcrR family transcriptional regulator n=1 Tax=Spinactinospora alkalitolerans TaxID=687207 RepID=A0A852TW50_9ACTN|nr:TetR/AcrR family transcriptional regulator [Spinactinospora alkalitolerans]NYE47073.1 AcrR family transcriptional regulator [Spinactinospora alkalitolerans]